ncbi:MAG: RagB/SusD family nutrient uptake outer membrane protein [Agriterribacter sp.]
MTHKYKIAGIIFLCAMVVCTISCKRDRFLDTVNKVNLDDETMWSSEQNADIFLNGCYAKLYPAGSGWPDTQMDNFSDDAHARVYFGSYAWKEGNVDISITPGGGFSGATGPSNGNNSWQATYVNVRNINLFIQKITENSANFSTAYIGKRIDEARFLRAYFYSELFMRVGGFVIDTVVQSRAASTLEELQNPRNTYEESFNFIIQELDEILNNKNLEIKYSLSDADAGRATLGAAMALKGWLQLFAASPAYNASSPAVADPGNLQHFESYSAERWAVAAETNKKFIETWGHKGSDTYYLFNDMVNFWREENEYNSEVVWDRQFVAATMPNYYGAYGGPCNLDGIIDVDWGEYQPTQSIIDDFQMDNGKDITDPTSGYNDQDPYAGREKRFYDFICYDGSPYYREWMSKADTVWMRIDKVSPRNNEIDLTGANDATQTGYWFTKQLSKYDPRNLTDCGQNYVFYRYAEVLLNYAEAQNEAVGPDASVYEAIDAIRTRPGTDLPALAAGLSKDEMRKAIHRERRIELAYEQKRLWDIWRWKEADERLNQPTMGTKVYNSKPNDNSGEWIYEKFELAMGHVFTNKMYFCPIPQEVIDRNPKIVQNLGY